MSQELNYISRELFTWLAGAVTEHLTSQLLKGSGVGSIDSISFNA
jgi:hypothetical protein